MEDGIAHDVTVVIPVYNRECRLKRCLDSIGAQTLRPAHIIVVDDGSEDGSAETARAHYTGPLVIRTDHEGAPAARNAGLAEVKTEWTMFFDSDDTMEPDHIEAAVSALNADTDLVGWDVKVVMLDGTNMVKPFATRDMAWNNLMHGTFATQRYMARTALFREAGGWNPAVRVWNDVELGARLVALNPRVVKVKGIRVNVIRTEESITGKTWSGNIDKYPATFEALRKSGGNVHPDWLFLKQAILAADIAREDAAAGKRMYDGIEGKTAAVRLAYYYRRAGFRGAARLLRMFFSR